MIESLMSILFAGTVLGTGFFLFLYDLVNWELYSIERAIAFYNVVK
mgnify:CR=1 FL=1